MGKSGVWAGRSITQNAQMAAPGDFDRRLNGLYPAHLTHRICQCLNVLVRWANLVGLKIKSDDFPAAWDCQRLAVRSTEVIAMRFSVGRKRAENRR
jgi:hypothetical protein